MWLYIPYVTQQWNKNVFESLKNSIKTIAKKYKRLFAYKTPANYAGYEVSLQSVFFFFIWIGRGAKRGGGDGIQFPLEVE